MSSRRIALAVVVTLLCCGADGPARPDQPQPSDVQATAEAFVKEWAKAKGGRLPPNFEVAFFISNFRDAQPVLARALRDSRAKVRQSAAYVIEKVGPDARPLTADLLNALKAEADSTVRIHFCNALRGIGNRGDDVLNALRAVRGDPGTRRPSAKHASMRQPPCLS